MVISNKVKPLKAYWHRLCVWLYEATHEPPQPPEPAVPTATIARNLQALRDVGARFVDGKLRDRDGKYLPLDVEWPYEELEINQ